MMFGDLHPVIQIIIVVIMVIFLCVAIWYGGL